MGQKLVCPHCNQEITLVVKRKAKIKTKEPKKDVPMTSEQFQAWCNKSNKKFLHIIGAWAMTTKVKLSKVSQWNVYISRNSSPARDLEKFSDEQIQEAFSKVEEDLKNGLKYQPALETLLKKLTK